MLCVVGVACDGEAGEAGETGSDGTGDTATNDTGTGGDTDTGGDIDTGGETGDTGVWGQAALDFLSDRLVGQFSGEWQLYGLDAADEQLESFAWTDIITGSNPRIESDRALVDIVDEMDGGRWQLTMEFNEGVYIAEDGGIGNYFMLIDGVETIVTEVEPNRWEYTSDLTADDLAGIANVTEVNYLSGWKLATKLVSWVDEWERHDVSVLTHVEYDDGSGTPVVVEFQSLAGYHQKYE